MNEKADGRTGRLYGLGVGPGDPELLTLKALRILQAVGVIAYPAPDTGTSFARAIVAPHLPGGQEEIAITVPMRIERFPAAEVYDGAAEEIAARLDSGLDVAVLCEGDPFFYGSFMYLFERLAARYQAEIVPGISSVMAAAAASHRPLAARNDILTIAPGPLDDSELEARINAAETFAIIKLGRHFPRVRALIDRLGLTERAFFAAHVTLPEEVVLPLADAPEAAPYFSMILGYKGMEKAISGSPARRSAGAPA